MEKKLSHFPAETNALAELQQQQQKQQQQQMQHQQY